MKLALGADPRGLGHAQCRVSPLLQRTSESLLNQALSATHHLARISNQLRLVLRTKFHIAH
jgi:hypothetical protein